jgi:geranylgeranyl pyrophosphate synthase
MAASADAWQIWYETRRARVEQAISARMEIVKSPHSRLAEAVQYGMAAGGKRLRPILVLETCEVCGGGEQAAVPAAVAIECVHAFSLLHDDLPAMDDDDLRRGRPTCHRAFDEATAILAGDWLLNRAFALLSDATIEARISARLCAALAAGTAGMIAGQAADMQGQQSEPSAELAAFIHEHKTARLFEAACTMGAICAAQSEEPEQKKQMARFGLNLGLAFQMVDDLLDATGDSAVIGKQAGKDAGAAKQTYPAIHGLEETRRRARLHVDEATRALDSFGGRAENLRGLARFVLSRDR